MDIGESVRYKSKIAESILTEVNKQLYETVKEVRSKIIFQVKQEMINVTKEMMNTFKGDS